MKLSRKRIVTIAKWIGLMAGGALILFLGFYASIFFGLWGKIPTTASISDLKQSQATEILDRNDDLIGKLYIYDRQSRVYSDFPQHLIDALIATEDIRFYEHDGVDNRSLMRVFFKTLLLSDDSSGGGSTITLQLAKNLFGRSGSGALYMVVNKIKESIIAKRIESIYSKKDILTMYLNTVPFPDNTYGIESAAQKFFNVHTKDLSLSQSAVLIGSLKANNSYNPRLYPEKAKVRRNIVLQQMTKYEYLTQDEVLEVKADSITLSYQYFAPNQGLAPYFRAEIKKQLDTILKQKQFRKPNGEPYNLFHDGLKIYTTLDNTMQRYAEESMSEHMKKLQEQNEKAYGQNAPWLKNKAAFMAAKKRLKAYKTLKAKGYNEQQINAELSKTNKIEVFSWDENAIVKTFSTLDSLEYYSKFLNAGMLALDPNSGEIRAYVGGIDYQFFQYDHIAQSKRQVGSTFKPIVYTAALENGMPPCSYFPVKAVTYTDVNNWTPTNSSDIQDDDGTLNYSLQKALSNSVNTVAVKVLYETGIEQVIDEARKMGIESAIEEVPSIALGVANLSMLELAKAYTTYVNGSKPSTPLFITRIEDKNGNVIASFKDLNPKSEQAMAFSDDTRQEMLEFMKATVNEGTANRLRSTYQFTNDIAGKTGTTQDNKDGWFVGITPKLVTVTWVGNDNQQIGFSSTGIGQGANSALPIFANFLQKLNSDSDFNALTQANFEIPSDAVLQSLDCELTTTDGFFKRLLGSNKDSRTFEKKEKKGIFGWLKKKKD